MSIKERLAKFGRRRNLDKTGVAKEPRKSQNPLMNELSKKLMQKNDNLEIKNDNIEIKNDNLEIKEDAVDKELEESSNELKRVYKSLERKFDSLKKSVSSRVDKYKILKDAKNILKKYVDEYETVTMNGLREFKELSENYGLASLEKFEIGRNKALFDAIKSAAKKTILTEKTLKILFKKIFTDLNQTGQIAGGFMDPYTVCMQAFMKMLPPFSDMLKEISRDDYSLFRMRRIKKDIEQELTKNFTIVDLSKLGDQQYRLNCKEKLGDFTEKMKSLISNVNEEHRKLGDSDSQERFLALVTACFR